MLRFTLKSNDDESVERIRDNVAISLPQCFGHYFGKDLNNSSHNNEEANSIGFSCCTGWHEGKSLRDALLCTLDFIHKLR